MKDKFMAKIRQAIDNGDIQLFAELLTSTYQGVANYSKRINIDSDNIHTEPNKNNHPMRVKIKNFNPEKDGVELVADILARNVNIMPVLELLLGQHQISITLSLLQKYLSIIKTDSPDVATRSEQTNKVTVLVCKAFLNSQLSSRQYKNQVVVKDFLLGINTYLPETSQHYAGFVEYARQIFFKRCGHGSLLQELFAEGFYNAESLQKTIAATFTQAELFKDEYRYYAVLELTATQETADKIREKYESAIIRAIAKTINLYENLKTHYAGAAETEIRVIEVKSLLDKIQSIRNNNQNSVRATIEITAAYDTAYANIDKAIAESYFQWHSSTAETIKEIATELESIKLDGREAVRLEYEHDVLEKFPPVTPQAVRDIRNQYETILAQLFADIANLRKALECRKNDYFFTPSRLIEVIALESIALDIYASKKIPTQKIREIGSHIYATRNKITDSNSTTRTHLDKILKQRCGDTGIGWDEKQAMSPQVVSDEKVMATTITAAVEAQFK